MSSNFQLKFESSDSAEDEEEEDEYWGKSSKSNKFKKAIFTDSESEENETSPQPQKQPQIVETVTPPVRKPATQSAATSFLAANPVSNRALSKASGEPLPSTRSNTEPINTSSTPSSVTFNSEYSMRSKPADSQLRAVVAPPQPRPKFTMPATIIQQSAFTSSKQTASVFSISKNETSPQLTENKSKDMIKENLDLKTRNSQLETELKLLSSKLEDKPDFKSTINRILLDKPYWFDCYKNKRDKIDLLKAAVDSHDGNAILAVCLFIKRTLTKDAFHSILINNPPALNQYLFHLEQMDDTANLAAFHKYHGNLNEAALITSFKPILCDSKHDLAEKTKAYHDFEASHSPAELNLINNSNVLCHVKKYLKLLKVQKEILRNNSAFLRKDVTRQTAMDALNQSSLAYTVSFCLKFNRELNDNDSYSVESLKKEFDLNTKQFSIWFIKSMSECGSWTELESYTKQRGIFNMVKNPPVSYETIVFMIAHVKGPGEQIRKYLNLVENLERRQQLAMKFREYEVVVETFRLQRDKIGLLNFRNQFRENTPDYIKANIVLMDDKVKWKN